jgi:hypothetical protein
VELNPDTYPDTFIGHNDDGPAVFKLFPEAKDVVEGEIPDPEENSAVSRMVVTFVNEYLGDHAETIIQELLKEEYMEQIVNEILKEQNIESIIKEILSEENVETIIQELIKEESIETIVQEILQTENVDTIVQEVLKPENISTIVQEILKADNIDAIVQAILNPENIQRIVQEVLKEMDADSIAQDIIASQEFKDAVQDIVNDSVNTDEIIQEVTKPENTTVIVEQVIEQVPIHLVVTMDYYNNASHSAAEIKAHLQGGGSVELAHVNYITPVAHLRYIAEDRVAFYYTKVADGCVWENQITVNDQKKCTVTEEVYEVGSAEVESVEVESYNVVRDGQTITMTLTLIDDTTETHVVRLDDLDYPTSISVTANGITKTITGEWSGF